VCVLPYLHSSKFAPNSYWDALLAGGRSAFLPSYQLSRPTNLGTPWPSRAPHSQFERFNFLPLVFFPGSREISCIRLGGLVSSLSPLRLTLAEPSTQLKRTLVFGVKVNQRKSEFGYF